MDFTSIINQIISYIRGIFASFDSGTMSQSSVLSVVNEYINSVIETYSSSGLGINANELRTSIADEIKTTFANTENESIANEVSKETKKENSDVAYSYSRENIPTTISTQALLVINGHDYTRNIIMPSWKINSKDIYEEKTNANKKFIRTITRSRIMGTFTIAFDNTNTYSQFMSDCWNGKGSSGELACGIWVNNMNQHVSTKVYFSMEPQNQIPSMEIARFSSFEVTVEEQ